MARSRAGRRLLEFGYVVVAFLITFGVWFGPDVYDGLKREMRSSPATSASPPPVVSANGKKPEAAKELRPIVPDVESADERNRQRNAQILERMAQTCAFWSSRSDEPSGRVFRDRACKEMRRFAAKTQQVIPRLDARPAPSPAVPRSRRPSVHVNDCGTYERGSIRYRQCRASEKQRLKQQCQYHRQREQWSQAGAWCAAADRYWIVG